MTRYIKFEGHCYYVGTAFEEYLETDMSDEELDKYVKELMEPNAESYQYLVFGWDTTYWRYSRRRKVFYWRSRDNLSRCDW